jgi:hypothetical protein
MKTLTKLKTLLQKEDGCVTNAVAANGNTIAGASPGEMPPVNKSKIVRRKLPKTTEK